MPVTVMLYTSFNSQATKSSDIGKLRNQVKFPRAGNVSVVSILGPLLTTAYCDNDSISNSNRKYNSRKIKKFI